MIHHNGNSKKGILILWGYMVIYGDSWEWGVMPLGIHVHSTL